MALVGPGTLAVGQINGRYFDPLDIELMDPFETDLVARAFKRSSSALAAPAAAASGPATAATTTIRTTATTTQGTTTTTTTERAKVGKPRQSLDYTADGVTRKEFVDKDGTVHGSYSYKNPEGQYGEPVMNFCLHFKWLTWLFGHIKLLTKKFVAFLNLAT